MQTTQPMNIHIPEDTLAVVTSRLQYADHHCWILWAWAALARAGDVEAVVDEYGVDYAEHLITLTALGRLYDRFHDVYSGVDTDHELLSDLTGDDRPEITQIELGRYCERHGYHDALGPPESAAGLSFTAVSSKVAQVQARLCQVAGDARLFTSLAVARHGLASAELFGGCDDIEGSPLGSTLELEAFDPYLREILVSDLTFAKHRTYEWLTGNLDVD